MRADPGLARFLTWMALGLAACIDPKPRVITYGEEPCAYCHMTIAEPRFAGQLVTRTGKIYLFDDLSCLSAFLEEGSVPPSQVHSIWVNDFLNPQRSLAAESAQFFLLDSLRSPMASGLVAVARGTESDSLAKAAGHSPMDWEQARRLGAARHLHAAAENDPQHLAEAH